MSKYENYDLSIINNYVHPFNSFKRITTNYDETNGVHIATING